MTNAKQLIQHYESITPRMSQDLKLFLDLVWTHRYNTNLDVYNLYGRSPSLMRPWVQKQRINVNQMTSFLIGLTRVPYQPEWIQGSAEIDIIIQYNFRNSSRDFIKRKKSRTINQLINLCHRPSSDGFVQNLGQAFFHYQSMRAHSCNRIYLNVRPVFAIDVFCWVINHLVYSPEHPFCNSAKIAGPLESRSDTIVIYLFNEKGLDKALEAIANYQNSPSVQWKFCPEAPRLTKPVLTAASKNMQGVSIGDNPPRLVLVENDLSEVMYQQKITSFGSTRSNTLCLALKRILRMDGSKEQFINEALQLLDSLGVDPRHPHLQLNRDWYNSPYILGTRVREKYYFPE